MNPTTGMAEQISKMRNQAFRILYDTLLESVGIDDEQLHVMVCMNLRRIVNAKFAALAIIDADNHKAVANYVSYDLDMVPICKQVSFEHEKELNREMLNKCKIAQIRKCVADEVCLLKYYDEEIREKASGKGECVGISCIKDQKVFAVGLVKMSEGSPLRMLDMLDNYLNLASVLLSRIQAVRDLGRSNQEMQHILSAISNLLIMVDVKGNIIHWNATAEEQFGIDDKMRYQPLQTLARAWDWPRLERAIEEVHARRETLSVPAVKCYSKDEEEMLFNITLFPCAERHAGIVMVGENISQNKRGAQAGAFRHVDMLLKMIGTLLESSRNSNMQIMKKLGMLSDQLSEDQSDDTNDSKSDVVQKIGNDVSRNQKMAESMKSLMKSESAPITEVDLNVVLESVIGLTADKWQHVAGLEKKMCADLPLYHCREVEVNTVFFNLLTNAIQAITDKFSKNSEKGHIVVSSQLGTDMVIISIINDGEEIPEENRSKIFEPFYTTWSQHGNIGQGLLVSRVYIQKYGGDVVYKRGDNGETVFEVHLPIQKADKNVHQWDDRVGKNV